MFVKCACCRSKDSRRFKFNKNSLWKEQDMTYESWIMWLYTNSLIPTEQTHMKQWKGLQHLLKPCWKMYDNYYMCADCWTTNPEDPTHWKPLPFDTAAFEHLDSQARWTTSNTDWLSSGWSCRVDTQGSGQRTATHEICAIYAYILTLNTYITYIHAFIIYSLLMFRILLSCICLLIILIFLPVVGIWWINKFRLWFEFKNIKVLAFEDYYFSQFNSEFFINIFIPLTLSIETATHMLVSRSTTRGQHPNVTELLHLIPCDLNSQDSKMINEMNENKN